MPADDRPPTQPPSASGRPRTAANAMTDGNAQADAPCHVPPGRQHPRHCPTLCGRAKRPPRPANDRPARSAGCGWRSGLRRNASGDKVLPPMPAARRLSLVRAPRVRQMAGQAPRRDQHHVESQRRARPARAAPAEMPRRRARCAGAAAARRRMRRRRGRARLDLDHREHPAAPRDDVDLAGRAAPAAGDDPPSAQPQMPRGTAIRPDRPRRSRALLRRGDCALGGARCSHRSASGSSHAPARGRKACGARCRSRRRAAPPRRAGCARRAARAAGRSIVVRAGTGAASGGPTTMTASPRGGPASR